MMTEEREESNTNLAVDHKHARDRDATLLADLADGRRHGRNVEETSNVVNLEVRDEDVQAHDSSQRGLRLLLALVDSIVGTDTNRKGGTINIHPGMVTSGVRFFERGTCESTDQHKEEELEEEKNEKKKTSGKNDSGRSMEKWNRRSSSESF